MTQRVLDVSHLPTGTNDSRALLWWGNIGMLAIEGTMFALSAAGYFYLRSVNLDWPPATVQPMPLTWPTVNVVLFALSLIVMRMVDRAAYRQEARPVKVGLAVCVVIGITFNIIRAWSFAHLGFKWSSHAYGSMIWTILGLHTFHSIVATGETSLLLVYSLVRPLTKKQYLDIRATAVYWYFVVLVWIPFYFLVYLSPYYGRK